MSSSRIAMIIDGWDSTWGGGQIYVKELCSRLSNTHHYSIDLFVRDLPRSGTEKITQENSRWRVLRNGPRTAFFNLAGRLLTLITFYFALRREHRRTPYSLVHAHTYLGVLPAYLFAKRHRLPLIVTMHGTNLTDLKKKGLTARVEQLIVADLEYDTTISVTQKYLRDFPQKKKAVWIPVGVDTQTFSPSRNPKKSNGSARLIFVGRLDGLKGVDILLEALQHSELPFNLDIVGDGPEKERFLTQTKILGLEKSVRFLGFQPREAIPDLYRQADVFVLPSFSEGMPLTLLEAMSTALPVVVTRVGEIPYIIEEHKNGWLAEPQSVSDLQQALSHAYQARQDWDKIGEANRQKILEKYTWDAMTKSIADIYQKHNPQS